ncbi:hypothetical protein HHI36_009763 [Cryptolaemus montrouzieri]|uniref:Uncharacterized protein n=1 Tax=Cryptolaemus montrouzieri TaxID=559131 RepID=A0ABD2MGR4_9CUCU
MEYYTPSKALQIFLLNFDERYSCVLYLLFIFRKKILYNPYDPKDAEELLNFMEQLSSDDECFDQVDESEELHLTLFPPEDGADSDQDDGPSEDDKMCRIGDIGKGVSKQKMDVTCILKGGNKHSSVRIHLVLKMKYPWRHS